MRKLATLLFCFAALLAQAQTYSPTYKEVLERFFRNHSFASTTGTDALIFAHKYNGWYVGILDLTNNTEKVGQMFWSEEKRAYQKLTGFDGPGSAENLSQVLAPYLQGGYGNGYNAYGYERCRYYGYNRWAKDMMNDFGKAPLTSLPDTALEGLGRAYAHYSDRFGWYQFGGIDADNEAQRKLDPLEKPSPERADSAAFYVRKSAACFAELKRRNPAYQTLVGNSAMKQFNEQMHGYQQMQIAGYPDKAAAFLREVVPSEPMLTLAKNYLSGCAPNAILITAGDNDTYPLWYLQEMQNYRKDVTVLNESLLGFVPNIHRMKNNKTVVFSLPPSVYGAKEYQYVMYQPSESFTAKQITPELLFQVLRTKKYRDKTYGEDRATYPAKELVFNIDPVRYRKVSVQKGLGSTIRFNLNEYITLDQLMLFDVLYSNLYKRPIYFTTLASYATNYLQQEGLLYRLLPLNQKEKAANETRSMNALESFLQTKFQFLRGADYAPDEMMDAFNEKASYYLFAQLAEWHHRYGRQSKAKQWLDTLKQLCHHRFLPGYDAYVGYVYGLTGDSETAVKMMEETAEYIYEAYRKPASLTGIWNKDTARNYLANVSKLLTLLNLKSAKVEAIISQTETE